MALAGCGSSSNGAKTKPKEDAAVAQVKKVPPKPRFSIKDLLKTTVTLKGRWVEADVMFDDKGTWHCSGVVHKIEGGRLSVVTNKHCTGLFALAKADNMGGPEVKLWEITVHTHNNRTFRAGKIAVAKNIDLAIITTEKGRFKKGRDFILPPPLGVPEVGDEVLAIGSPVDPKYSGTVTFGRVSALREHFIQHDAALNPGNSGGPLYAKGSSGYYMLAGINTYKLVGSRYKGINLEAQLLHPRA